MEESIWYGRTIKMEDKRNNPAAWKVTLEELIDQYQTDAYRYCIMLMGNREDAQSDAGAGAAGTSGGLEYRNMGR